MFWYAIFTRHLKNLVIARPVSVLTDQGIELDPSLLFTPFSILDIATVKKFRHAVFYNTLQVQDYDWDGTNLGYDANGNLIDDGEWTYNWNARNQLLDISKTTGKGNNKVTTVLGAFAYDGLGRRGQRTVNEVSTDYLYDGLDPVQELSGTNPVANILTGLNIDERFMHTDANGSRTLLTDGLGSTLGLADDTGTIQTDYSYSPFGETASIGQANDNPFQ